MSSGAGRNEDEAVGALLDRLVGEFLVDHIVKDDAAPIVRGLIEVLPRAERSDQHRHLVFLAERQIVIEPVVGLMHDLVHRKRRRQTIRMRLVVRGELFLDARNPLVEQRGRAGIQRRKRADHAGLALGDDEIGHGNEEQWRADHGDRQAALEQSGHGHRRWNPWTCLEGCAAQNARHHTNNSTALRYWHKARVT